MFQYEDFLMDEAIRYPMIDDIEQFLQFLLS